MWLSNLRFGAQFTLFTFFTAAICGRREAKPLLRTWASYSFAPCIHGALAFRHLAAFGHESRHCVYFFFVRRIYIRNLCFEAPLPLPYMLATGEGIPVKVLVFAFFFISSFIFLITFGKWLVNRRQRSSSDSN
jgi:hypothetical protein